MKVAVCMSGQMRTFMETFENQDENFFAVNNADLFVCTDGDPDVKKAVRVRYGSRLKNISVRAPKVKKHGGRRRSQNRALSFVEKMQECFSKCKKSNELRLRYEKANDFKYDVVVRMRPDMILTGALDLKEFPTNDEELYAFSGIYTHSNFASMWDGFAFGGREAMNVYADLVSMYAGYRTTKRITCYGAKHGINPEAQLLLHLQMNDIAIKPIGKRCHFSLLRTSGKSWSAKGWDEHPDKLPVDKSVIEMCR